MSKNNKAFTIHYLTVGGVEVSTGFNQEHQEGQMVSLIVENKYKEWQKVGMGGDGLPAAGLTPEPVVRAAFGGGAPRSKGTFPVAPTDGQMSIIRQNSMNRAVEILAEWRESGLFTAATEDQYLRKLMEVALTVTDFNSGQDIMKLQAAIAANQAVMGE